MGQFSAAEKCANRLHKSVNEQLLSRKLQPDRWSAQECVGHLITFGEIYYARIKRQLQSAVPSQAGPDPRFRPRLFWRGIIGLFEPPYRLQLKTIAIFAPDRSANPQKSSFARFTKLQRQFKSQIDGARQNRIDLSAEKIENPALPLLKMSLAESYGIVLAHQRRHLWQARQTVDTLTNKI